MTHQSEQKLPRTPPGPPDFVEGPQLPTPGQLADWKQFQHHQQEESAPRPLVSRESLAEALQSLPTQGQEADTSTTVVGQWEADETPDQIKQLHAQGVKYVRWMAHPGATSDAGILTGKASAPTCPDCVYNDQIVVSLGEAFPSGSRLPPAHPHCRCTYTIEQGRDTAVQAGDAVAQTDFSQDY